MSDVSIAVLPFVDGSPNKEHHAFCDGVANDLINALGNAANLHIAPRSASFAFGGGVPDFKLVGQRLGVGFVLHGTLTRTGDRLALTAKLTKTADGADQWAKQYQGSVTETFNFADDILSNITASMSVQAVPGRRFTVRVGSTTNVKAYDQYLEGLGIFHQRYNQAHCERAIEAFSKAVELDAGFAKALSRLADCHSTYYSLFDATSDAHRTKALAAAERAVAAAPDLPLAHTSLGIALTQWKRFDEAEASFEKALAMNPRYFEALYHYARAAFQRSNLKKAAELFERAEAVRHEDYQVPLLLRQVYLSLGRLDDAMKTARRGILIAQQALALNPREARAIYLASGAMIQLGMYREAVEWAQRALAIDPDDPIINYNVACSYAQAGEPEKALDCLDKAKKSGMISYGWLKNDSDLVALITQPRFQALLKELEAQQR